ncbi:hypothetical protein TrLO_g11532 [Triparma laevis f. longispina]|uniref:Uncharacterized protein n=1 Tax=Triparma laevis f. longispina TaxID=1714387 RepID=A0A9W7CK69_9STRA|nr:hypothetical protein TrLO_g11532 [Triparma laevis f. longispina]
MRKAVNKYGVTAQDVSAHTLPNPNPLSSQTNSSKHEINDDSKYLAGLGHINSIADLTPIDFSDYIDDPFLDYFNRLNHGDGYIVPCDPYWNTASLSSGDDSPKVHAFALHNLDSFGTIALVYGMQIYRDASSSSSNTHTTATSSPSPSTSPSSPSPSSPPFSPPNPDTPTPNPSFSSSSFSPPPEIWFRDRSNKWWFMCNDFTCYLRLMIVHLGIRGWWASFTTHGLDPNCRQLMIRFCPERMLVNEANKIQTK